MTATENRGWFRTGEARSREAGRKGGQARAAQRRQERGPYEGTILDVMDAAGMTGPTWKPWRAFWKSVFGLELDQGDLRIFKRHTERDSPPLRPVKEVAMAMGRRAGKTNNAALAGLFLGIRFDSSTLTPGETAVVMILAADRRQGRACFGYLRALLELSEFKPYVHRVLKESVELRNNVKIEVHTASYRSVRGYTVVGCICDEIAFWMNDDRSANPDHEVVNALRPGMATVPRSLLIVLSSPYSAKGVLHSFVARSFGKDDAQTLVWNADTLSMNPTVPSYIIERAFEEDPVAAASEYGRDHRVQFRRGVEAFLDAEAIRAVTATGCLERPPEKGIRYVAFTDPSGGSQDSFTLAIAHLENGLAVLDAVREVRPPFSPDSVVRDFADLLRTYRVSQVTGDRYGGNWPAERFQRYGISYKPSKLSKSDLYRELVAPINGARVALLDLPVLQAQLIGLERSVARGGKDSIDHGPGARDDVANSVAGALTILLGARRRVSIRWGSQDRGVTSGKWA